MTRTVRLAGRHRRGNRACNVYQRGIGFVHHPGRPMMYQQAQTIEQRLTELVRLIRRGRHSTPELASALGVSVPTASRCIAALRQRGYGIRSVRLARQWAYELVADPTPTTQG